MTSDGDQRDLLDTLYDLAMVPATYDVAIRRFAESLDRLPGDYSSLHSHLDRASALVDAVDTDGVARTRRDRFLESRMHATMLVDHIGTIVAFNEAASVLYQPTIGIKVGDLLKVDEAQPGLVPALERVRRREEVERELFGGFNPTTGEPISIAVAPYEDEDHPGLSFVSTNEIAWPSFIERTLREDFKLTHAEIAVLRLILEGKRPREIAASRSASEATVRTQLRALYDKTGSSTQTDLVRWLFGLVLMHGLMPASPEDPPPSEGPSEYVIASGDRRIAYRVFGPRTGRLVLLMHCDMTGDGMTPDLHAVLGARNIKMIVPIRPGYGRSPPPQQRFTDPDVFARTVSQILSLEGAEREVPVLAVSIGLRFAAALAKLRPDLVSRIVALRPFLPITDERDLEGLHDHHEIIPRIGLTLPSALPFVVRAGFAWNRVSGTRSFIRNTFRASPRDVAFALEEPMFSHLENASRLVTAQGAHGFLADNDFRDDWTDDLLALPCALDILTGEDDCFFQTRKVQTLESSADHITHRSIPGAGYFLQQQKFGDILDLLLRS
ncbi:MAG: LuxR C-terminal-related transcriptional regulator [Parvularcula sp.]|jgi:DNA-binding CsgD family transcriptional regulator/pimeloyl-ACP methyl ester carboxylesterase|nr:LuxR C-terminal-related transcriptional regulator [Parvularcula sp.]